MRPDERVCLDLLLSEEFKGCQELRRQAELATVRAKCSCCANIWFALDHDKASRAELRQPAPASATKDQSDGMFVQASLTTKDGYLETMEIWRSDLGPQYLFPDMRGANIFVVDPLDQKKQGDVL